MPEPAEKFSHPTNRPLLALLRHGAAVSASPGPYNVDEYVARCHPDLEEAFYAAAGPRAPHCRAAAYGYPVLVQRGIVFGVAMSMRHVLLRLPPDAVRSALSAGATPEPGAGDDWVAFDAWRASDLAAWCTRAFERAQELAR